MAKSITLEEAKEAVATAVAAMEVPANIEAFEAAKKEAAGALPCDTRAEAAPGLR